MCCGKNGPMVLGRTSQLVGSLQPREVCFETNLLTVFKNELLAYHSNLVLAGISATNAIDRVYAAYPRSGRIAMRKDSVDKVNRKNGSNRPIQNH